MGLINALIVNPQLESRTRLRQLTASLPDFGKVQLASTLAEALQRLETHVACNVVYISARYDQRVAAEFVLSGRKTAQGQGAAYMAVLGETSHSKDEAMGYIAGGLDGVLVEPASLESILQATKLAISVSKKRDVQKQFLAIDSLLSSASQAVDRIALAATTQRHSFQSLRAIGSTLSNLSEEALQLYLSRAIDHFTSIEAPIAKTAVAPTVPTRVQPQPSATPMARIIRK